LLLCPPAGAENLLNRLDLDLPHRSPPTAKVMSGIENLPVESRYELFTLYQAYIETVNSRRAQHWRKGLLNGEIVDHPDEAILPVRQLEEAAAKREPEVAALEAQVKQEKLDAPPPPVREPNQTDWSQPPEETRRKPSPAEIALKAKRKELKSFKSRLSRSKGLSLDWSDAVWADLQKVDAEHWSITDQARTVSPRHTGAVVCTPADAPTICVVFDPWKTGEPDVYEYSAWDGGSFENRVPPEYMLHGLPDRP
jgi:hypothetical protein